MCIPSLTDYAVQKLLESEMAANTTAGVAAPDNPFRTGSIAGHKFVEVDHATYTKCQFGKVPYAKWNGYIEDEGLRSFIQKHYSTAKTLLVVNKDSGAAAFLRRPKGL